MLLQLLFYGSNGGNGNGSSSSTNNNSNDSSAAAHKSVLGSLKRVLFYLARRERTVATVVTKCFSGVVASRPEAGGFTEAFKRHTRISRSTVYTAFQEFFLFCVLVSCVLFFVEWQVSLGKARGCCGRLTLSASPDKRTPREELKNQRFMPPPPLRSKSGAQFSPGTSPTPRLCARPLSVGVPV